MNKNEKMELFDIDAQLDAKFGKKGTASRAEAEERAYAFFTGQMIEDVRKNAHLTQQELAERIGTNKSYISRMEHGLIDPKVSTLYRIASALGMTIELKPIV